MIYSAPFRYIIESIEESFSTNIIYFPQKYLVTKVIIITFMDKKTTFLEKIFTFTAIIYHYYGKRIEKNHRIKKKKGLFA